MVPGSIARRPPLASGMPRTAVLRHDLPDGTHHYDWFIEPMCTNRPHDSGTPEEPDDRVLITWRLKAWPIPEGLLIPAERLTPHRRLYLDYQGPISDNRGEVRRVDHGLATILIDTPDRFVADVTIESMRFRTTARPVDKSRVWHLDRTPL